MKLELKRHGPSEITNDDGETYGIESFHWADHNNIDYVVDDGELDELKAECILDNFPFDKAEAILSNWVKKLAHGGQIIITCLDIMLLCKNLATRQINLDEANNQIYNGIERRSGFSGIWLSETLKKLGLNILKVRTDQELLVVIGQRP